MAFFNMDRRIINKGQKPWGYLEEGWTPDEITNLVLWLDADDTDTITLDGSNNVEQWNDKSGNDRHAVQSDSGDRPGFSNNTVQFDGTNRLVGPALGISGSAAVSIFIVVKRNSMSQIANSAVFGFGSSAGTGGKLKRYSIDEIGLGTRFNNGNKICTDPTNSTDKFIFFGSNAAGANYGNHLIYCNGVEQNLVSEVSPTNVPNITNDEYSVGEGRYTDGSFNGKWAFDGDVCECIVFSVDLDANDSDRQKVEGYLAHKWGLAASLSETHPYKDNAP